MFRPGFVGKVQRTSVVEHYGVRTLLYGTLLPGPDIGRRAASVLRRVRDAGYETGIHCWDHVRWQDGVASADEQWTRARDAARVRPLCRGLRGTAIDSRRGRLADEHPRVAPHATTGIRVCSDGRGTHPHLPVWRAELIRCPQLPTTLPTLDELIGTGTITEDNVAGHLLERTRQPSATGHVFTLHAELEGGRLSSVFEQLLIGWKAQGWSLGPLRELHGAVEPLALPRCEAALAAIPGRTGTLLMQGDEFLGDVDVAHHGR